MNKARLCFIFLSAILIGATVHAQEVLTGIVLNKPIAREAAKGVKTYVREGALPLPFVDDFSNYLGYPNPHLWADRKVFVNNTFALRPPTLGVATLDALDENGRIYSHADAEGFRADTLTSNPIRLDYNFALNRNMRLSDSLYLSFYYQPGGGSYSGLEWERRGNQPEGYDSLILEFGYATGGTYFAGYDYCEYVLQEGESYLVGDTLQNPYIQGLIYVFEESMYEGMSVMLPCDSIILDEYYWEEVWSTPGTSLDAWLSEDEKCFFKQVLIPIRDDSWLIDKFQFRFRNLASLESNGIAGWAGNVDQWHIDYVRLDVNRSADDIYQDDIAFSEPTTTILRDYYAMPWNQFRTSDLRSDFSNALINLSNTVKTSDYTYRIVNQNGVEIANYNTNSENIKPYTQNGLHDEPEHTSPAIQIHGMQYDGADSARFVVTHVFKEAGAGDMRKCNDTCVFMQKFGDYYAYDDGTAEAGYSLMSNLTNPQTYFAMRFSLAQPDTLRAVQMWFNAVLNDDNFENFTLLVWNDNNGEPGDILYEEALLLPRHEELYSDFVTYYLKDTLPVEGVFYVGFFQNHNVQLNLGFDQNSDGRAHFLYKTTTNWQEPFLFGTPMVRAVLGSPWQEPLALTEHPSLPECKIYPNPAHEYFTILSDDNMIKKCNLFDATGRLVKQCEPNGFSTNIHVSDLKKGIYFVQIIYQEGKVTTQKIIIQ